MVNEEKEEKEATNKHEIDQKLEKSEKSEKSEKLEKLEERKLELEKQEEREETSLVQAPSLWYRYNFNTCVCLSFIAIPAFSVELSYIGYALLPLMFILIPAVFYYQEQTQTLKIALCYAFFFSWVVLADIFIPINDEYEDVSSEWTRVSALHLMQIPIGAFCIMLYRGYALYLKKISLKTFFVEIFLSIYCILPLLIIVIPLYVVIAIGSGGD